MIQSLTERLRDVSAILYTQHKLLVEIYSSIGYIHCVSKSDHHINNSSLITTIVYIPWECWEFQIIPMSTLYILREFKDNRYTSYVDDMTQSDLLMTPLTGTSSWKVNKSKNMMLLEDDRIFTEFLWCENITAARKPLAEFHNRRWSVCFRGTDVNGKIRSGS